MKENWIKKLIELLNQFEKERKSWFTWRSIDSYDNCVYWVDCDWETEITMYSDLYSKYYWFIEWLVENDKIDYKKLLENSNFIEIKSIGWGIAYSLTMLLSIQDNPIEFLVSILK
jgi:hypothetical protein